MMAPSVAAVLNLGDMGSIMASTQRRVTLPIFTMPFLLQMNDGPLCRCSAKARRYGIRHGIYAGENHLTHIYNAIFITDE